MLVEGRGIKVYYFVMQWVQYANRGRPSAADKSTAGSRIILNSMATVLSHMEQAFCWGGGEREGSRGYKYIFLV